MDRRSTVKKLIVASGTLVALPTWANGWSPNNLPFKTIFSNKEQELLSTVANTIIPSGDSIGALSVGVDKFLHRLFSDCYEEEVQEQIKALLKDIDASANKIHGSSFERCDQIKRLCVLEELDIITDEVKTEDRVKSEDQLKSETFKLIKSETIRGFRTSKEVMTKYLDYQIVPGHYHGCVDVNT